MLSTLATRTTHSPIRTYAIFYCVAPDYMHFWTYISHLRGWLLQNILKEPRNRLVHGTRRKWRATKSSIREERRMANKTKQERSRLMATYESPVFGRASYAARIEVGYLQRLNYENANGPLCVWSCVLRAAHANPLCPSVRAFVSFEIALVRV